MIQLTWYNIRVGNLVNEITQSTIMVDISIGKDETKIIICICHYCQLRKKTKELIHNY